MRQKEPLPSKLKFPGNTAETPFSRTGAFRMQNKQFPVENPAGNRLGYPDAFGPSFLGVRTARWSIDPQGGGDKGKFDKN